MSFHNETVINKSRKPHKCSACKSIIDVGDKYYKHAGVFDGTFYDYKLCPQCNIIIKKEFESNQDYRIDGIDIERHYWDIDPIAEYIPILEQIKNKSTCIQKLIAAWKEELQEGVK